MTAARKGVVVAGAALIAMGLLLRFAVPPALENAQNKVLRRPPYSASERAVALAQNIPIADLHSDSLLWGRDLLKRSARGHVDVPRLIEGHITLQVFSLVSKVPFGLNIERNSDRSDMITPVAMLEGWPLRTWRSLLQRALYQADRLHRFAARSGGKFTLVTNQRELNDYLQRRQRDTQITAGLLSIEGAQVLEGKVENLDSLYAAGFRMMSPAHFFDTEVGGSAAGEQKGGLSPLGRDVIRQMESRRMIVDVAHASPQTIADILAIATRPVVASHTGVKGTCNNNRNLSDQQLQGIAKTGGVVGIGYWETAVCGTDAVAIGRAVRYTANLIGVEHVGLGSDFDGAVAEPFDTTGLAQIVDALLKEGFSEKEIAEIMGGNVLRLLQQHLPQ